ncbi:hypothetical protein ACFVJW_32030 [Streptomyces libani]|uniref:Uncharacterized protein n=1 Tax=Streptomyces nigrescens TaxID=1920 RepID=A0A640TRN8_STRNI|nr:hypothetical protein [Streptomyces libani]WAU00401.1 hypothetical protein STRLI_006651 [Streptomyces libani subsp. libani]GFE26228.1 hypothetical protein Sliba_66810 [Streptomyces libani subsp. libani]GGV97927.1 hypothetical protein GCM10010500_44720 [Streptomyces libani subsp. libani]
MLTAHPVLLTDLTEEYAAPEARSARQGRAGVRRRPAGVATLRPDHELPDREVPDHGGPDHGVPDPPPPGPLDPVHPKPQPPPVPAPEPEPAPRPGSDRGAPADAAPGTAGAGRPA